MLEQLDTATTAETTCMIGDSPYDVGAALAGGWGFAGVTTGTHTEEQLREAGATDVFADLPALARHWGLDGAAQ